MEDEKTVQSVVRILNVIEALNHQRVTPIETLHRTTGLPKSTLVRLLDTLMEEGYVFHVSRRDGYALTERVLRLSAGYRRCDSIVDIARPILEAFTKEHRWQVSLATLEKDSMLVRFNTKHMSPFAPDQIYLNRLVGMLVSALGRAYIAYCPLSEREMILTMLRQEDSFANGQAHHPKLIQAMIDTIRHNRYATIERLPDNPVRSFAIPIMCWPQDDTAIASIAMFYYNTAMSEKEATGKYLDKMYAMAEQIAKAVSEAKDAKSEAPHFQPAAIVESLGLRRAVRP